MSYTDFIWENFGLLEWLLCIELIVLLSAAFFYQIAKFIAKTDRHDPLVRFYRVFWISFALPVTPTKQLELASAEAAARSMGHRFAGDMDDQRLTEIDAPDLGDVADADRMPAAPTAREMREEPAPASKPAPAKSAKSGAAEPPKQSTATFDARIIAASPADRLVGIVGGEIVVEVTHEVEDGQANGTVLMLVAERIGIPPYRIALLKGHYKVRKTFQVDNIEQSALDRRLAQM